MKKQVCLLLSGLLLAGCGRQDHRPPSPLPVWQAIYHRRISGHG